MTRRVAVVGGGVTGLAAALRLRDVGGDAVEIIVFEKSERLGGKLCTGELAGCTVEAGAEMMLLRQQGEHTAAAALVRRVGLAEDLVHPAPVPPAIAVGGALHPLPTGTLFGIPSMSSTVDEQVAKVADADRDEGTPLLAPGEDVAVGELVRRRLGDEVVDRLVDPLLGGVYAGRADRLSLAATMPGLHRAASSHTTLRQAVSAVLAASPGPSGMPMYGSVRKGLTQLVDAMAAESRADIRLRSAVCELSPTPTGWRIVATATTGTAGTTGTAETTGTAQTTADGVILAAPAGPSAALLRAVDSTAARELGMLRYANVALVTLALPAGTQLPELSGLLVPADQGYAVKAVTFVSTKWPHLRHEHKPVIVRLSLGRDGDERALHLRDDELVALAHAELKALVGAPLPDPLASRVTRWDAALPQYPVGHLDRVAAIRAALPPTLALAGAAYDGVGIAACVRSGQAAATAVWRALGE